MVAWHVRGEYVAEDGHSGGETRRKTDNQEEPPLEASEFSNMREHFIEIHGSRKAP